MSLWNKNLSNIDYSDIDDFCNAGWSEGPQLDYKREIPKDLSKLVAAFANSRGGLILLGVEADKTSNQPKWPCDGMDSKKGLSEQIMQMCRDNLYPSVMPEISSPIDNPNVSNKVFVVVRVDESSSAPHSTRNGKELYVRTGDTNHPIDLMHVDKIDALLKRRMDHSERRESIMARHIDRSVNLLDDADKHPLFWCCISPQFPDVDICDLDTCQKAVFKVHRAIRAPEGYIGFNKIPSADAKARITGVLAGAGRKGDIFYSRLQAKENPSDGFSLHFHFLCQRLLEFVEHCIQFLNSDAVRYVGQLVCSVGVESARGALMQEFHGRFEDEVGPPFPDSSYRRDIVANQNELLDSDSLFDLCFNLMSELGHAFGIAPPPNDAEWWTKTVQ